MTLVDPNPRALSAIDLDEVDIATTRAPAIDAAAEGQGAFEQAYPELYAAAFNVAWRWTRDRERAADIAQEAAIRAYANWRKLGDHPARRAWIMRVAGNLAIADWRKREVHGRYRHLVSGSHAQRSHDADTGVQIDVARALAMLPQRQREAVVLRYLEDQHEADVAAAMGCSIGAVRKHTARGLAALRATLGENTTQLFDAASDHPEIDAPSESSAHRAAEVGARRRVVRRVATGAATALAVALIAVVIGAGIAGGGESKRIRDAKMPATTTDSTTTTVAPAPVRPPGDPIPAESPSGATGGGPDGRGASAPGTGDASSSASGGAAGGLRVGGSSAGPSSAGSVSSGAPTAPSPRPVAAPVENPLPPSEQTIFGASTPTRVDPDGKPTEVGVQFRSEVAGTITGVRFYKFAEANATTHTATLWDATGRALATVTFADETAAGWQRATFGSPVPIAAGVTYTLSYFAPNGRYASDQQVFGGGAVVRSGPLQALAGVYRYPTFSSGDLPNEPANAVGPGMPVATYLGENYWVDPVFVAA